METSLIVKNCVTLGCIDDLSNHSNIDLSDYSMLLCRGDVEHFDSISTKLHDFVQRGGNLYLHRPGPATIDTISQVFRLQLDARSVGGSVRRADGEHPLLHAISREDLYWSVKQIGTQLDAAAAFDGDDRRCLRPKR